MLGFANGICLGYVFGSLRMCLMRLYSIVDPQIEMCAAMLDLNTVATEMPQRVFVYM